MEIGVTGCSVVSRTVKINRLHYSVFPVQKKCTPPAACATLDRARSTISVNCPQSQTEPLTQSLNSELSAYEERSQQFTASQRHAYVVSCAASATMETPTLFLWFGRRKLRMLLGVLIPGLRAAGAATTSRRSRRRDLLWSPSCDQFLQKAYLML